MKQKISKIEKYRHKVRIEKSLNLVESKGKVLDIGCNDGKISILIKNKNNEVYGIDRKNEILQIAEKRGIKTKLCNLERKIPFPNNNFDGAVCLQVIEHIYNTDLLLKEINRILKKDTYLILSAPNICAFRNRLRILFGKQPCYYFPSPYAHGGGHLRVFSKNSLKKILEKHGFKIEKFIGNLICFSPFVKEPTARNSSKFLANIFPGLADYLIIKVRKIKSDEYRPEFLNTGEKPKREIY